MSRITGSEAKSMVEAYSAVYASQELTEEQIWEEVENWVNSLVEEGYDLSEYTWEDMYESYIEEQGRAMTTGQATAPISNAPYQSRFARPMNAGTPQRTGRGTTISRPQVGSLPSNYRGQELQAGARARASQVGTTRQGTAGTGAAPSAAAPRPAIRPAPAPVTRPAAPVARPATTSTQTAKPQPSAAAVAPAAPASTTSTNTTRPSLAQQAAELRKMRMASQMRQAGANVTGTQMSSFDMFDVVKAHLLDEGYADNEESALVIMANMGEEWKQSIVKKVQIN
jgi:hypothetical protein